MIICNKITNFLINKNIISINDRDIYIYGLFVILYNAFLLVNIIIIGLIFNKFVFSLLFLLFWTPYRIFVGGSHCSTPLRCWLFFDLYFLISILLSRVMNILVSEIIASFLLLLIIFSNKIENKKSFIIFFMIYFILLAIPSFNCKFIMSIAYILNSILTLHKIYLNKDII